MRRNKDFIYGLITGIIGICIIYILFFAVKNAINVVEKNLGYEVAHSEYDSFEDKVDDILKTIDKDYLEPIDKQNLYENAYRGLLEGVEDPYTVYYDKEQYKKLMEMTKGAYQGIGVVVSFLENTKEIVVVLPFVGSPGEKAGLLPGDIIQKVDGIEVTGKTVEEAVALIKGEEGTEVVLTIYREGLEEPMDMSITRAVINVPTVDYEMMEDEIGLITITGFEEVTYKQFKLALDDLEKQGQRGLIIDLRNNPGGLLSVVAGIADELLPKGLIVYTEDKNGKRNELSSDEDTKFEKPLVILINENSASASEILAGAVKDSGIGTLVGTTTFGKGLVQRIFELEDGSAMKVTIAKYYTPSGAYIHGVGIEPNITVPLSVELKRKLVLEKDEDIQLQKAIEVILNQ